jgi:hypothetical protein
MLRAGGALSAFASLGGKTAKAAELRMNSRLVVVTDILLGYPANKYLRAGRTK